MPDVKHRRFRHFEKIEEQHIRRILAGTKSLQEAADILGSDQAMLWRRRKKHGI